MKLDHPRVASGPEFDPNACRIEALLDEEILPRLERPARCLGPLEPHGIAHSPADSTRFVLVWPSVLESHALPAALRPVSDALRERLGALAHVASVPAGDFARELAQRDLPLTSRPFHRTLDSYPLWLVWMQWPHQVFGLLTMLRGCGLAARAHERNGAPLVLLAGPGAVSALRPFADAILPRSEAAELAQTLEGLLARPELSRDAMSAEPLVGAEEAPPRSREGVPSSPSIEPDGERLTMPWIVQPEDLKVGLIERTIGALGGRLSIVHAWAASERLRAELGLASGEALVQAVRAEFAVSSEVAVEIAVGLPGERPEDRAAILPLARRLVREAPHGPKQLLIKVGPYVSAAAAEPAMPSPAALRDRLEGIASDLRGHKIRCELGDPGCAWTSAAIASAAVTDASVIEWMHEAGARVGESALACRPDLWHKAWQAEGVAGQEPEDDALTSSRAGLPMPADAPLWRRITTVPTFDDPKSTVAAETGLPAEDRRTGAGVQPSLPRGDGQNSQDRWTRWQALAPRQFDYRLEFAKRGPMRFVGHRELWSMWVGAIAAAGLPLATSGLVQPRPKITFGPPLPLGVEGLHEYVDVSLTRKTSDLRQTLNDRFPSGLWIREAAFIPAAAGRVSLGMVTRADYEVRVRPDHCSSGSLPTLEVEARARRLADGSAGSSALIQREETTIDLRTQIAALSVREDSEGVLQVTFSLDLATTGAKARPQDVLAYLLADEVRDLRTLPIQRLRLLAPRDESGGPLLTPMEQVRVADRTLRARAKMCD